MATKTRKTTGIQLAASDLKTALQAVSPAVPGKTPKPILHNVRIGDGLVVGTDLEVQISAPLDYHGDPLLLPHARLLAILNAAGGDTVTLDQRGSACLVQAGHGQWTLPTEDASEFPKWEPTALQSVTRLPADEFERAVRAVSHSCDAESSRFALGAVLVDVTDGVVTFVATDGRRLSAAECEHDLAVDDSQTLVPDRVMAILARLCHGSEDSVQLEASRNEFVATIGGTWVTARLLEGKFPRWRDVIPADGGDPTTVLAASLLAATRSAAICTSEQSKGVTYTFGPAGITLKGKSAEAGESTVECEIVEAGTACTVSLNPEYVRDWLTGLPADGEPTVSVQAKDAQSAVVLRSDSYTGVIMPLAAD